MAKSAGSFNAKAIRGRKRAPKTADVNFPGLQHPMVPSESARRRGSLVLIGGREDKRGIKRILCEVADRCRGTKLVIATFATQDPEEVWEEYRELFEGLGLTVEPLHVDVRDDAFADGKLRVLDGAGAVFFTGGDQLRITSRIGGAPVCDRIRDIFNRGGTIAGTSAGASAMSETMLVSAPGDVSHRIDALQMAPGLGFINGVIIDQHFAERGRLGRLVGAVSQNPRLLGIGVDEDTAVIAEAHRLTVLGSGAVYIVDGVRESYTNASEEDPKQITSVFDLRLHILCDGDTFDLQTRRPERGESGEAKVNGRKRAVAEKPFARDRDTR